MGEWHYHPGGSAQPSAADIRQMRDIAKDDEAHCPEPILLVMGENNAVTAHVFPRDESAIELTAEYAIRNSPEAANDRPNRTLFSQLSP